MFATISQMFLDYREWVGSFADQEYLLAIIIVMLVYILTVSIVSPFVEYDLEKEWPCHIASSIMISCGWPVFVPMVAFFIVAAIALVVPYTVIEKGIHHV